MNQPQNSTILNGPSGELTMAFKETQNAPNAANAPNNQNFRPQLQRNDSRVQGGAPQASAQGQGQPQPPRGVFPGQAPQFRPPNFQQQIQQQLLNHQQQRFAPPPQGQPQGQSQGQPLFRPQQRFVAVNPPGTARHNFRPPGPPGPPPQGQFNPPGPPQGVRPQRPPQQLQGQRSQEGPVLARGATVESDAAPPGSPSPATDATPSEGREEKDAVKMASPSPALGQSVSPAPRTPTPTQQPAQQQQQQPPQPPQSQKTPEKQEKAQEIVQNVTSDAAPPTTLQLNASQDSKNSSSPSPQPDTVVEKAPEEKGKHAADNKPPRVPRTPTKGASTARTPSRNKKEGDNDSGVDESTQGAEHSTNGDRTPRKATRNGSRPPGGATPTKHRSFSRGSRSPHLASPGSQPGTPGPTEGKKLPMNKIQVGAAPSPNLKVVKSKIGSLANAHHKPGGGNVKIETKKVDVSKATSRIGAKNESYTPTGGDKKIISQKLQWTAKSKIGSLDNASHKPKGGDKKIETVKLDFKDKAKSKVGSKDNIQHQPGGGDVKIIDRKVDVQAESKIKSLDNVNHKPGGGDKKIFDDKDYLRQMSAGAMSNENDSVCGSQSSLPSQHSQHSDSREPVSDENLNREN